MGPVQRREVRGAAAAANKGLSDEWGFWEFLSWENADRYHADLIMVDNRSTAMSAEQLAAKATWRQLPAVKAGQTVPVPYGRRGSRPPDPLLNQPSIRRLTFG
ncbi:ABC transporter substrate-binding protein [Streptomyces sp. NPDC051243]|uniref:ABC transporter substrate-binding protein n=1 Tax=Streptomyces sp. NPDC051243 TaxID=3365646 RepID=UPI0037B54EFB